MAIAIEAEMVPLRQTVLIPKVEIAFDDTGVPIDPGTNVAMSVMLDDLAWWSALLAHGRGARRTPTRGVQNARRARRIATRVAPGAASRIGR